MVMPFRRLRWCMPTRLHPCKAIHPHMCFSRQGLEPAVLQDQGTCVRRQVWFVVAAAQRCSIKHRSMFGQVWAEWPHSPLDACLLARSMCIIRSHVLHTFIFAIAVSAI